MNRRTALKYFGTGALVASAGCASVQEQGGNTTTENTGGQNGDETSGDSTATDTTESSGPAGTAKAWYSLPEAEVDQRKKAIKNFNGSSKHTINGADISDMRKKTTSAIPAGQGPQTFEWAHDWVGDYYQRGFITGQGDELSVSLDKFTDAAASAVQFKGKTVGLPHDAETVALVYNKDKVDSAPKTVAEMKKEMKKHHDPDNGSYGLGYPIDPYFASAWAQAFGGYYFDPNKDPMLGLSLPETVKGFKFLIDNFKPYMPNDPSYEAQASVFASGNAAFAINGPWYLATLNKKGVNVGVTELPKPKGGEPNPYTTITMWYFAKAMKEGGASAAAARSFVEWYATNEDLALKAAKQQGSIPVLKSLAGSDELPPKVKGFSKAVEQGVQMPTHPKMNKVWGPLGTAVTKAFNGDASVEKAMKQAEKSIRSNW